MPFPVAAAAILGGSSLLSGFGASKSSSSARKSQRAAEAARTVFLDPGRFLSQLFGGQVSDPFGGPGIRDVPGFFPEFLKGQAPRFDELSRAGGIAQSNVATSLARRGLSGTGIGVAASNAAQFIPGQLQFQGKGQVFQDAIRSLLQLVGAQGQVPIGGVGNETNSLQAIGQAGGQFGSLLALLNLLGGGERDDTGRGVNELFFGEGPLGGLQ